ncbi:hypothetical protein ACNOYE_01165 [Nannocystaceae bacterium ST9]
MPLPDASAGTSIEVGAGWVELDELHRRLAPARCRLVGRDAVQALIDPDADPALVHGFMVQFAALSVQLQEPAEQFLVAASQRCEELGERGLARALLRLAADAIDHYRLFADDARVLALQWNARQQPELDLTGLLIQPNTPAMRRIFALHGQMILGDEPWTELALVCEIEALIAAVAPLLVLHAERCLGSGIRAGMRSVVGLAIAGDRGRARATMAMLLADHPGRLPAIVRASERMLDHYGEFLDDCMVAAVNLAQWRALAHG